MKRKGIEIKGRFAHVPMTVNQLYWEQYEKILHAEINKGDVLTHSELVVAVFGEDKEYWRSLEDVNEYIYLSSLIFKIYQLIKTRTQRTELKKILHTEVVKLQKTPLLKRLFKKVKFKKDGIKRTEIIVDDKIYNAPSDLRWKTTGQYQDALEVTSVIHSETELIHRVEAYKRLFQIYFYPIITGNTYTPQEALAFDIGKVRWRDVLDFGDFFLIRLNAYQNGIQRKPPKLISQSTNSKQAMTTLAENSSLKA